MRICGSKLCLMRLETSLLVLLYKLDCLSVQKSPTGHTQTDILMHEQSNGAIKSRAMRELLCRRDGEVGGLVWEGFFFFFERMKRNNGGEGNEKRRKGEGKVQKEGEMEAVIYLAVER